MPPPTGWPCLRPILGVRRWLLGAGLSVAAAQAVSSEPWRPVTATEPRVIAHLSSASRAEMIRLQETRTRAYNQAGEAPFDRDRNGNIDDDLVPAFYAALRKEREDRWPSARAQLLARFDRDGDQGISYAELEHCMWDSRANPSSDTFTLAMIMVADLDGNRIIDRIERTIWTRMMLVLMTGGRGGSNTIFPIDTYDPRIGAEEGPPK